MNGASDYCFATQKGLTKEIVIQISQQKGEPLWMTDFRLAALELFLFYASPYVGS